LSALLTKKGICFTLLTKKIIPTKKNFVNSYPFSKVLCSLKFLKKI